MESLVHDFCTEQRELLNLEWHSETNNRNLQLHSLQVEDLSVGLYGRTLVQLQLLISGILPAHGFTAGDEVDIQSKSTAAAASGVIHQVTDECITVALFEANHNNKQNKETTRDNTKDETDFLGTPPLSLVPRRSMDVHKKLMAALEELETHGTNHPVAGSVIQTAFSPSVESSINTAVVVPVTTTSFPPSNNPNLDDSQNEAIHMALHQTLSLLHGPPGSGKTTTVVELIRQAVHHHKFRVLVTAPSHVAVDNLLARLVASTNNTKQQQSLNVVRLGHPARLQQDLLSYSLEALVQAADGTNIVADVRKELQTWLRLLNSQKTKYEQRSTARREIKLLRQEIKQRERKVVQELLQRAQVVLCTCVGAANRVLSSSIFDLVIIDEAAQSLEAACWIPALRGKRLVLAGDHCQLPPTIICNDRRVQQQLGHTMFARIMKLYQHEPDRISRMLKVQYRMHETIADWASEALYHGELKTHSSAQGRTLASLSGVLIPSDERNSQNDDDLAHVPLVLIDTAGCDCYESTNAAGSRFNPGEAHIVRQHVQRLLEMGVPASQIAVITPYSGQVEILKSMGMSVEIRTVDGFQGGEREAVVLSLVRSSPPQQGGGSIGFLRDDRRLNVAVTRAKRHCCVVADSETVSASPFVKNLLDWIDLHGEHWSALDYINDTDAQLDQDMMQAQLELQAYLLNGSADKSKKDAAKKKHFDSKPLKNIDNKASAMARTALLDRVRKFHQTGIAGDELVLSKDLLKGDRHAVHELAEELGLLHVSSGTEGMNRSMAVSIPRMDASPNDDHKEADTTPNNDLNQADRTRNAGEDDSLEVEPPEIAFHVLQDDGEESSESEDEKPNEVINIPSKNTTLALLAKEREQREKERRKTTSQQKKNGENVSGSSRPTPKVTGSSRPTLGKDEKNDDEVYEIEDDMAFLDTQIEKVQNSHGRTIIGKGSNYRTIVNGILLGKPNPVDKKKDPRATSALQAKLKQAENSRKAKSKPKKK